MRPLESQRGSVATNKEQSQYVPQQSGFDRWYTFPSEIKSHEVVHNVSTSKVMAEQYSQFSNKSNRGDQNQMPLPEIQKDLVDAIVRNPGLSYQVNSVF